MTSSKLRRSTCFICLFAFGCGDRDCDQWYSFETPPEVHGGLVGERTFYYGEAGLLTGVKDAQFWPPDRMYPKETHTTEDLLRMHARGPTMLLVGTAGTIRYSLDNANTWQIPEVPAVSTALSSVDTACSQSKTSIAVGQAGTILRTDDLEHWSLVPSPVSASLHDVAILTSEAIAVGDAGTVLVSKDLGITWSSLDLGIAEDIIQMSFHACDPDLPSDGPGLLMTAGGQFYSRDAFSGRWQRQFPDAPGKPQTMLVFDQLGLDSFGGFRVQIAIDTRLWVMNPRENGEMSDQAWTLKHDFQTPILAIFAESAVLTQDEAHYYRDGYRCSRD